MHLVFLHGPAASGKLTTARALGEMTGYAVFHNHLVVDALTEVFPFGSEPFVRLRERFWLKVFASAAEKARSLVFTFTPEHTVSPDFPTRACEAVEQHGGRVGFVRLDVSEAEQERRINGPDRHEHHKLTDLDTLRRLRSAAVARPVDDVVTPPADLVVDTDTSAPETSARAIVEAFGLTVEAPTERYPE